MISISLINDPCRCFKWDNTAPGQAAAARGVNVCYGRHTGYGGYGNLARGARQIVLKQESLAREVLTWIRLEDGLVPENVTLNATYGQDEYHRLPDHAELKRDAIGSSGNSLQVVTGLYAVVLMIFLLFHVPLRLRN